MPPNAPTVKYVEEYRDPQQAARLAEAIRAAIASRDALTADVGGTATSRQFTDSVLARLR
jgi:isocitrate/isopropylmalate dehydrogenase